MSLLKRAIKELCHLLAPFYWKHTVNQLASVSMGYVGVIYLRQVIDQLTIHQFDRIMPLVLQMLTIQGVLLAITSWLSPHVELESELTERIISHHIPAKMGRLQYHYADSADTKDLLYQIKIINFSSPSSFFSIAILIPEVITSTIHIIWSFILLWPILSTAISSSDGTNNVSVIFIIGFLICLIVNGLVIVAMQKKQQATMQNLYSNVNTVNLKYNYEFTTTANPETGKEIRIYNLSKRLKETMNTMAEFTNDLIMKMYRAVFQTQTVLKLVIQLSLLFVLSILGYQVLAGLLTVGLLIQVTQGITQLFSHLGDLITNIMQMTLQPEALELYYQFMDFPEAQNIGTLPVEKRLDNQYHLGTENLTFAYPGTDRIVLNDITVDFDIGKNYAIVGENGSGKSTFVKLLMRLYEPTSGDILLNGIEADKYYLNDYFNLFSVVFQDFDLLSFTIGENISVSQTTDQEAGWQALDDVNASRFVKQLPDQLNTYIGTEFNTDGKELSGGQRQKIAMARAMYKDAPIVIMDEPTAALDPVAEFEIYQNVGELVSDKTAFFISHRLSSCRFCDEILVFDEGEIVQRGRHEELVKQEGKYKELWQAQAQYYQSEK